MTKTKNLTFAARSAVYFFAIWAAYQLASNDGYEALFEPVSLALAFFLVMFAGSFLFINRDSE